MFTPPPADDPNSAVVAAHSKAAYDQHWEAAKSSGKLVSWPLLLFPLLLLVSPPTPRVGCSGSDRGRPPCFAPQMVIDFSASWCGPCRFIEPAFKEMASRYTDVVFVKIDVDELAVRLLLSFLLPVRFVRRLGGEFGSRSVRSQRELAELALVLCLGKDSDLALV